MQYTGNFYSIAPSNDFLTILVDTIMRGELIEGFVPDDNPFILSTATIFVPSRRAARALSSAFLEASKQTAIILPQIRTLGDVSDEEFGLSVEAYGFESVYEQIEPWRRRFELANFILYWVKGMEAQTRALYGEEDIIIPSSRADALKLAEDLCVLLDQFSQEEISWDQIQRIEPDIQTQWWRLTLEFLKIVTEHWPQYLSEQGLIDPAQRATQLLDLRAKYYSQGNAKGPVIVAGSTGSVPSTQRLLKAIAGLKNGAVVLPGLDKTISASQWNKLGLTDAGQDPALETHPQFGLARLLSELGIDRDNVIDLGKIREGEQITFDLVSTALAPAELTASWFENAGQFKSEQVAQAFSHITLLEANNERQEALAIAIAMRGTLEEKDKSVALVTPDRNLAHRVSLELQRFGIEVDDSGGTPLKNTPCGIFLRQLVDLCFGESRNTTMAAVMKSQFCLAGRKRQDALNIGQNFEIAGLRGNINAPIPGKFYPTLRDIEEQIKEDHYAFHARRITTDEWERLLEHCIQIDELLVPLLALRTDEALQSIPNFIKTLQDVILPLSQDETENSSLYQQVESAEITRLFEDIIKINDCSFEVQWQDFPAIFDILLSSVMVRPSNLTHMRLHIFGPLEIRLLDYDTVILAGLNEGKWPQNARNDAFLNRIMRQELHMASPERRIGLAAHDFQQLMGKRKIILSRATKVDKAPSVASRWLQRLGALIGSEQWKALSARGKKYLSYSELLDETLEKRPRIEKPQPTPPVEARPIKLPVSDIETWIRDPYALYAKKILDLKVISPLEREPDALIKGTLYHGVMEEYVKRNLHSKSYEERLKQFVSISKQHIEEEKLPSDIAHIWLIRLLEIGELYLQWEEAFHSKESIKQTLCEESGRLHFEDLGFTLTARGDRLDITADDQIYVMDYKTGINPSTTMARTISPQLALEGLIAQQGGFKEISPAVIKDLAFIRLRRGNNFKYESIKESKKVEGIDDIIANAQQSLSKLITGFQNPSQPYISRRAPYKEGEITGDYDHLARAREWSYGEEEDGDG